ncbi:T9SS type A sorting domain-containing protein [Rubrivirga marina]|uniref:Secretion system C-terminal sorting domain-containing protein n=1 Tax=Rubrivirga marina TaxID=1196024 RepID=A0A271J0T1_9BACT|nr:T9SS type A sorting domain-containing protein [Rubrivirga marina]PAP76654.1 hypothetical protein BSZ37_09465 [Rubrivirga marina]
MPRSLHTPARLAFLLALGLLTRPASAQSGCGAPDPLRVPFPTLDAALDQGFTLTSQRWDRDAQVWENEYRSTYRREELQTGARLFARWSSETESWLEYVLDAAYTLDADRRLVETRYMNTEGEPYQRDVVIYGTDGYPSIETREDRWGTGWVGNRRYIYDYTPDGQLAGYRFERNYEGWTLSLEYEGTFDEEGRRVLCAFRSDTEGPFTKRIETTYDDRDRPLSLIELGWDGEAGTYVQVGDSIGFTYPEVGHSTQIAYHYVGFLDLWRPERRSIRSYDAADRLVEVIGEVYAGSDPDQPGEWLLRPVDRVQLGYHDDGRLASHTRGRYEEDAEAWVNDRRYLFEYAFGTASETTMPSASGLALAVAPNPSAGAFVARLSADGAAEARVVVFDALGRRVRIAHDGPVAAGETALPIDLRGLPAGVYVLRARVDGAIVSQTVTVVR